MVVLFLLLNIALVLFINAAASLTLPRSVDVSLSPDRNLGAAIDGASLLTPTPFAASAALSSTPPPRSDFILDVALQQVRLISLIGVVLTALVGGAGAYLFAGYALRPVRDVQRLAEQIDSESLDRRLDLRGPADELKALGDAFDRMLGRLERAFEQQSRFVADAAHELRTPLATLRTNLEVVQSDPNATLQEYRQLNATLERALRRIEKMVDDLLLLAQGEGETVKEAVHVASLLEEVLLELKPLADDAQVSLDLVAGSGVLAGDAILLARALSNLVENGIRYNQPGGFVRIKAEEEDECVVITVVDNGIGIPDEELEQIFERFYRVDHSRSRASGGTGLGLAITEHIIDLHQGLIDVQSKVGDGTTFTVRLPRDTST